MSQTLTWLETQGQSNHLGLRWQDAAWLFWQTGGAPREIERGDDTSEFAAFKHFVDSGELTTQGKHLKPFQPR